VNVKVPFRVVLRFVPAHPPVLKGDPSPPEGVEIRVVLLVVDSVTLWFPLLPSLVLKWLT
jgi:hypothetical protein